MDEVSHKFARGTSAGAWKIHPAPMKRSAGPPTSGKAASLVEMLSIVTSPQRKPSFIIGVRMKLNDVCNTVHGFCE